MRNMNKLEWERELDREVGTSPLHWVAQQQLTLVKDAQEHLSLYDQLPPTPGQVKDFKDTLKLNSDLLAKLWSQLETLYPMDVKEQVLTVTLREVTSDDTEV